MRYTGDMRHGGWWKPLLTQNRNRIGAEEHGFGKGDWPLSLSWGQNLVWLWEEPRVAVRSARPLSPKHATVIDLSRAVPALL